MKPRKKVTDPQSISVSDIPNKNDANPDGVICCKENSLLLTACPSAADDDDPPVAAADIAGVPSGNSIDVVGENVNIV